MSESTVADLAPLWRVRKADDTTIYGPVDKNTLKAWANSAQLAPSDYVDRSDEQWRIASEMEFLEMVWVVKLPDEEIYGPTTVGTLREFVIDKLITEKTVAKHARTLQSLPVGALLAALDFEKRRVPRISLTTTGTLAVEMAKDQRIRQLEEDLRELRKEHESLTQRYRQLSLQMQQATRGLRPPG